MARLLYFLEMWFLETQQEPFALFCEKKCIFFHNSTSLAEISSLNVTEYMPVETDSFLLSPLLKYDLKIVQRNVSYIEGVEERTHWIETFLSPLDLIFLSPKLSCW